MDNNFAEIRKNKIKKFTLAALLLVYVSVFIGGFLFFSKNYVKAAPVEVMNPITIGESIVEKTKDIWEKIKRGIVKGLVVGFMRMVTYFMERVAHDVAVYAASGGRGQGAMVFSKGFAGYMADVADNAAGTFLEELGDATGIPICHPPDINIDLNIRIGLHAMTLDKPNCKLSDLRKNWSAEALKSKYGGIVPTSGSAAMKKLQQSISSDQSDLSFAMDVPIQLGQHKEKAQAAAAADRAEGDGAAKAAQNMISGRVTSPAQNVKGALSSENLDKKKTDVNTQAQASLKEGFIDLLPYTATVFINTFLVTTLQNFLQGGTLFGFCVTGDCGDGTASEDFLADYESGGSAVYGRAEISAAVTKALTVRPLAPKNYDILSELFNCPDDPGTYNCAADEGILKAVQQADLGEPMTIADAMKAGFLQGKFQLISDNNTTLNQNPECRSRAYCIGNIRVLRLVGILPLGFEIAASISPTDKPVTLQEVIDGFYNPNSDYYHLVDPNWVLKTPVSKCAAEGYTPVLLDGGPNRLKECVDLQQCVGFNKDGTCYAYGYCTRSRNVWRFNVDTCEPQNRTCKAFTNKSGNTVSYLYRTLDTGECTADNSGCTGYSLYKEKTGEWRSVENGNNKTEYFWQRDSADSKSWVATLGAVYLNQNASTNCSANSAGCSAFRWSENIANEFYLKKAPDYLQCYDALPDTGGKIDYPQNPADLSRIEENLSRPDNIWRKQECAQYAQPCIAEEVNCNWYAQIGGLGINIPGKFKPAEVVNDEVVAWNDQCDAQCVGYDTYKELDSSYANGTDRVDILPSSGKECAAEDAGCTGFTNLETTAGGVANTEYFSYLRPCIKPDPQRQKTFYTYEGADASGYQLKTYVLEFDPSNISDPEGLTGGPKYFYRTGEDLASLKSSCSVDTYKNGTADTDCRQFNDDTGRIYYRILRNTVAVSDKCTSYRLNNTDMAVVSAADSSACADIGGAWLNGQCRACFNNGEFREGYCIYQGLPGNAQHNAGVSHTCTQEADSCRAYKGSTGNSFGTVLTYDFESATQLGEWTASAGARISGESTQVGGHSYVFATQSGQTTITSKTFPVDLSKIYILSFWAKGQSYQDNAPIVTISGWIGNNINAPKAVLGTEWRYYQMRIIPGSNAPLSLTVANTQSSFVYLDNVKLVAVNDIYYLVKNSLSVPAVCDSNPYDNLPGEALGCQEYKNPNQVSFYLTNFEHLCRESAIGCTALVDTYNTTDDEGPQLYNYWITGVSGQVATKNIGGVTSSCSVPNGKDGCYVDVIGAYYSTSLNSGLRAATVYVSADNSTSSPIYLVANKEATCNQTDLGCVKAGLEIPTPIGPTYQDVIIKNTPSDYDKTLCTKEALGCRTFRSGNGSYFFKDPEAIGQRMCEYRTDLRDSDSNQPIRGWFWKGVGVCSNNPDKFCLDASSCNNSGTTAATCVGIGQQACYPDYRRYDYYGLFSYGSTSTYDNFVGLCPQDQSGCTKYVDHNDTSTASGMERSYYFLDNNKLRDRQKMCDAGVSLKTGCILLDQADNPNKLWNTADTYAESLLHDSQAVPPKASGNPAKNDATLVIKAVRDRTCGEWLTCAESERAKNPDTGVDEDKCIRLTLCNNVRQDSGSGLYQCVNQVSDSHPSPNELLDKRMYINRNVNWSGLDYLGYSFYGMYPVYAMNVVQNPDENDKNYYLMSVQPEIEVGASGNGDACGINNLGVALGGVCYYSIDGTRRSSGAPLLSNFKEKIDCRAYPEETSPFPTAACESGNGSWVELAAGKKTCSTKRSAFSDANICSIGDDKGCSYYKTSYTNSNAYFCSRPYFENGGVPENGPNSYCNGGSASSTADKATCEAGGGTYEQKQTETLVKGWQGYCVQRDIRRKIDAYALSTDPANSGRNDMYKCLAWWPLDVVNGAANVFHNDDNAGRARNVVDPDSWACLYNDPLVGRDVDYFKATQINLERYNNLLTLPFSGVTGSGESRYGLDVGVELPDGLPRNWVPKIRYDRADGKISVLTKSNNAIVWMGHKADNLGNVVAKTKDWSASDKCKNNEDLWIVATAGENYLEGRALAGADAGRFVLQTDYADYHGDYCNADKFNFSTNYHKFSSNIYSSNFSNQGVDNTGLNIKKEDINSIDVYYIPTEHVNNSFNQPMVISFVGEQMIAGELQSNDYEFINTNFKLKTVGTTDKDWIWEKVENNQNGNSVFDIQNFAFTNAYASQYERHDDWSNNHSNVDLCGVGSEHPNVLGRELNISCIKGVVDEISYLTFRVHFSNGKFDGIGASWSNSPQSDGNVASNYFFVIYLKPGYCKSWAQVSRSSPTAVFPNKPVAYRLVGSDNYDGWFRSSTRFVGNPTPAELYYAMLGHNSSADDRYYRQRGFSVSDYGLIASRADDSATLVTPGLTPNSDRVNIDGHFTWPRLNTDCGASDFTWTIGSAPHCEEKYDDRWHTVDKGAIECASLALGSPTRYRWISEDTRKCYKVTKAHFEPWRTMRELGDDSDRIGESGRLYKYSSYPDDTGTDADESYPNRDNYTAGLPILYNTIKGANLRDQAITALAHPIDGMFAQVYKYKEINGSSIASQIVTTVPVANDPDYTDYNKSLTGVYPPVLPAWCDGAVGGRCCVGYETPGSLESFDPDKDCDATSTMKSTLNQFTIDGKIGNIVRAGGFTSVMVRFFAYAHPSQMPIRRIMVDAYNNPDPSVQSDISQNSFPNLLSRCDNKFQMYFDNGHTSLKPEDFNNFGFNEDKGCKAVPYEYQINYNCNPPANLPADEMATCDSVGRRNGKIRKYMRVGDIRTCDNGIYDELTSRYNLDSDDVVCLYRPRIQVVDNWGISSEGNLVRAPGKMTGTISNTKVYCDNNGTLDLNCAPNGGTWVYYNGVVVVIPRLDSASTKNQNLGSDSGDELYYMTPEEMD